LGKPLGKKLTIINGFTPKFSFPNKANFSTSMYSLILSGFDKIVAGY
jgi:hypothetical protein